MNKVREKLQRFMIGRYGMDQLGQFIMYAVLVLIFLNVVVRVRILSSFLYIICSTRPCIFSNVKCLLL